MTTLPKWLARREPVSDEAIASAVERARRYLESSTPEMAVETQRILVAMADRIEEIENEARKSSRIIDI